MRPDMEPPATSTMTDLAPASGNMLLNALRDIIDPPATPGWERVVLRSGETLIGWGDPLRSMVFPEEGIVSILSEFGGGRRMETALVGREGVVGIETLFGIEVASYAAVVQVPGRGWRVPAHRVHALVQASAQVRSILLRYAGVRLAHVATSVGCSLLHPLRSRVARRLLDLHDRAGATVALTQEDLAEMLGARRPTVNAVLQELKAQGLITTSRGGFTVVDVAELELAACSCRTRLREANLINWR